MTSGRKRGDFHRDVRILQRRRLPNRQAERERAFLDRARGERAAAAARAVGLRENGARSRWREAEIASSEVDRERRRAGEDDRQAAFDWHGAGQIAGARDVSPARPSARSFRSFSIFLRTRWRFRSDR